MIHAANTQRALAAYGLADTRLARLGGSENINFRVDTPRQVVRTPPAHRRASQSSNTHRRVGLARLLKRCKQGARPRADPQYRGCVGRAARQHQTDAALGDAALVG